MSAIKVDGRRAHERVRAGEEFELESRSIRVDSIEVHEFREAEDGIDVDVSVRCSSGTYIRAIARDLGDRLETGGHLTALRRTAVGPFALDAARTLEQLSEELDVIPMAEAVRAAFPAYELDEAQAADVSFGRKLSLDLGRAGPVAMFAPDGEFLALYERVRSRTVSWRGRSRSSSEPHASSVHAVRIWRSLDDVPADLGRTVLIIGNFDGVHLGHRHVVRRAREIADADGLPVVAVTFDPHPMAVLRPEHAPLALTDIDRRCGLLAEAGVDDVFVIPFSREIASWTPAGVHRPGARRRAARRGRGRGRQLPLRREGGR